MLFWTLIWIPLLVFSALYSLLSSKPQGRKWRRAWICAFVAGLMIVAGEVYEKIDAYQSRVFAHMSSDGTVVRKRNFPWRIREYPTSEGKTAYILIKRTDGTELSVIPDHPFGEPNVYGCNDGVYIEFNCTVDELSGFQIEVKD